MIKYASMTRAYAVCPNCGTGGAEPPTAEELGGDVYELGTDRLGAALEETLDCAECGCRWVETWRFIGDEPKVLREGLTDEQLGWERYV